MKGLRNRFKNAAQHSSNAAEPIRVKPDHTTPRSNLRGREQTPEMR
jgi:hypothetical protein